ncbi:MAG: hypothetical protein GXY17_01750 [Clostridiaceae bacterium]|nr:hypothetical protein [Clostridiaceae bacterium]
MPYKTDNSQIGPYMGAQQPMVPYTSPFGGFQQGTTCGGVTMGLQQPMSSLPTGVPAGGAGSAAVPTGPMQGVVANHTPQVPVTVENPLFTPGFLRTQIGRRLRVEFLIGTNLLTDRTGTLLGVGASYILLRPIDSDDIMMCDIYSIKFATIIL